MLFFLLPLIVAAVPLPALKPDDLRKPVIVWSGQYPSTAGARKAEASRSTELIGTNDEWNRFWKARRGNEQIPRVDFSQMVIVVSTWPGMAADSLHLGRCGKNENGVWVGAWEGRIEGIGYVVGVFPRDGIKEIEGKPLPK